MKLLKVIFIFIFLCWQTTPYLFGQTSKARERIQNLHFFKIIKLSFPKIEWHLKDKKETNYTKSKNQLYEYNQENDRYDCYQLKK
ncbi:MAG: hypothetical protein FJX80_00515 [Bacteroidetes bacterium]|nr:hypothetical protein [Bacteroidota bacterium]